MTLYKILRPPASLGKYLCSEHNFCVSFHTSPLKIFIFLLTIREEENYILPLPLKVQII